MPVTSRGPSQLSFLTAKNSLLACGKLSSGITLPDQPRGGGLDRANLAAGERLRVFSLLIQ